MTTETEGAVAPENAIAPEAEKPTEATAPEQSAEPAGDAAPEKDAEKQGDKVEAIKRDIGRVTKRIDTLVAQRYTAEARASAAERQLADMQRRYADLQKVGPDAPLEEQDANRLRRVMLEDRAQSVNEDLRQARREAAESHREMIAARLEEAADRIPAGTLQKLEALPKFSAQTMEFVAESEKGAQLASYFADNPQEAARLHGLSPYQQGVELARLETRISVPKPRTATNAPPPPPRVTGNPGKSSKSPAEMSVAEMRDYLQKRGVLRK